MWEEIVACSSNARVAFCLPVRVGGEFFPIYWYGIIAAIGIIAGALYAQHHLKLEGEDPDIVWDALLWVLPAGIIGARLWFVFQFAVAGELTFGSVLDVFNPRQGGLNIFGGALFGFAALILYTRAKDIDGWALADASLMGLLIGQGIGRFGNLVNRELYGPPTELPWGIRIPAEFRLQEFASLPPETQFHPTMVYEAIWLFIVFGVMFYLFQRYQPKIIRGIPTGVYFILAGLGRFIIEIWRPDQPMFTYVNSLTGQVMDIMTWGQVFAVMFMLIGSLIVLDRTGYVNLPLVDKAPTWKERSQEYERIEETRRREERLREREKARAERRAARRQQSD